MSKQNLSNKPKDLKPTISHHSLNFTDVKAWFYEEPEGLLIVVQAHSGDKLSYIHIPIPWRTVEASVKRYTKK